MTKTGAADNRLNPGVAPPGARGEIEPMSIQLAAIVYGVLTLVVVLFQAALAAGAPWGELTMGGRRTGTLPATMRVGAGIQAVILVGLAAVMLSRAGLAFPGLHGPTDVLIWVVVAMAGMSLFLNIITPSKWERRIWAPVGTLLVATSLFVALAT